jgi:hypothetical protein
MIGKGYRFSSGLTAGLLAAMAAAGCGDEIAPGTGASEPSAVAVAQSPLTAVTVGKPAGVPADYVVTPAGFFHPSCVVGVTEDETVANGKISKANGASRAVPKCAYPRYDRKGTLVAAPAAKSATAAATAPVPDVNGWIESANNGDNGPLNWISANWVVPQKPAVDVGQTIYYFPGIQPLDSSPNYTIMQPVLTYNSGQWTIQSWNCCADGSVVNSPAAAVNTGDTIYGYVQGNVCNAAGVCTQWQVYTGDWTNGRHSTLNTTAYGNRMGWAFAGALEVYGVSACNHYPASHALTFTNIQVRNTGYQQIYPVWNVGWNTTDPLQCGYGVTAPNTNTVTLNAGL